MISLFKDEKGILCLHDTLTIKFITMYIFIDIPRVREVEVRNKLFFSKKKKKMSYCHADEFDECSLLARKFCKTEI